MRKRYARRSRWSWEHKWRGIMSRRLSFEEITRRMENAKGWTLSWFYHQYGVFSVALEISYHRAIKGKNLYVTADSIRAYGAGIAKVIDHLCQKSALAAKKDSLTQLDNKSNRRKI